MSNNFSSDLTFEERGRLASQVKTLRTAANLKQSELAEMAGISRQALSNIERGSVPQMDNLRRIYEVLGVDILPTEFSPDTTQWINIVGGIMDSLPADRRAKAGKAAVDAVTTELVNASLNVSGLGQAMDPHEIDLSQGEVDLAATTDNTSVQEQSHPEYEDESQDPEA